ncbi:hypothetical protein [Sphingomonas sp.]|uniref:hypothetical protein n=1 Tax=Sphingomonas sp. TaxID=28214 RepID=UPI003D6D6317
MTQPAEILYAIPVGTVVAWYPLPAAPLPPGFVYCDGAFITDADSPYNGMPAPNLINRFILGTTGGGVTVNEQGGDKEYNINGWTSGAIETGPTKVSIPQDDVQNDIVVHNQPGTSVYRYDLTSSNDGWNDGNHHHQIAGFQVPAPGWLALIYIIRIK